ncbi:MAG: leucine-rich repeat protein [Clostridia bacterium]|nr:leucine-rich repeat protein [Clostridia bacterium]
MKKIRKTLSLLLTFAMVLSLFAGTGVVSFAEENDILSYLTYTITDGEVTITDCDNSVSGAIVIPDTIEGFPVTKLENSPFNNCSEITSVTFPDSIQFSSFPVFSYCSKLSEIIVYPDNPNYSTHDGVLFNKDKTRLIQYPMAKEGTQYTIPGTVTEIWYCAFRQCNNLTDITVTDNVIKIYDSAFYGCENLKNIIIGNGLETIDDRIIFLCPRIENINVSEENEYFSSINGAMYNKGKTELIYYPPSNPATSISIPATVKTIDETSFDSAQKLTKITVDENNNCFSSDAHGVLFNKDKTKIIRYPLGKTETYYEIPSGVKIITDNCFTNCTSLSEIVFPESTEYLSLLSFSGTPFLYSNYELDNNLFYIGNHLIGSQGNMTECTIREGTVSIGAEAFTNRNHLLQKIEIPETIRHIGPQAFIGCSALENITFKENIETIGEAAFGGCSALKNVTFNGNVETVGSQTFTFCTALENVTFKGNVDTIGDHAFINCPALENVIFNGTVETIGEAAFIECAALKEISLPDGIKSIGEGAFGGCTSLKNITIPASVTSLGNNVFMLCSALEDITINCNISELNSEMFVGCTSLRNITFTGTVDTIGEHAFYGCTNLENVTFNSVKNVGDLAFILCSKLKNVSLNNVEVIGEGAFAYCTELESIDLGDISSIGKAAFTSCLNLESITVGENANYVVDEYGVLFTKDMSTLVTFPCNLPVTEYVIPDETTEIELGALFGCENLEKITIHENVYWDDTTTAEATWGLGQTYNAIPDPFAPDYNADDYYIVNTDTVIYGITGSPAHKYAIKYGVNFVDITTGEAPEDTTAPEESTTPAETTTAETTTAPEESTTSHEETTTAPEETTTRPEESTTVPAETTTVPTETTTDSVETTTVPPETTTVPAETTTVPPETTTIPAETTTTPPETTTTPEEPSENNQLDITEDSDIVVYEESKVVSIPVKSTSEDILAQLKNENVVILDKDGNAVADDAFVGTGAKLQLTDDEGNVINEYEVVAVADVDGNGKITAADARLALRAAAKIDILEGVMFIAADANSDKKVTAADARIILRKAAGLE